MKDIFSDLYDRVLSFFTSQNEHETKVVAKSRLKTVLMQDRVGFSERAMQMLKDDMLESIAKYLEIDVDSFDLSIDANQNLTILNLSIPVIRTKTDEEIDEALSIKEKQNIEKTQEIVGELQELVKEKAQALAGQINSDSEKTQQEEVQEESQKQDEEAKTETTQPPSESEDEDEILDKMLRETPQKVDRKK